MGLKEAMEQHFCQTIEATDTQEPLIAALIDADKKTSALEEEYLSIQRKLYQVEGDLGAEKTRDAENLRILSYISEHVKQLVLQSSAESSAIRKNICEEIKGTAEVTDEFQKEWLLETANDLRYHSGYLGRMTTGLLDKFMKAIGPESRTSIAGIVPERQWSAHKRRSKFIVRRDICYRLNLAMLSVKCMIAELNFSEEKQIELQKLLTKPVHIFDSEKQSVVNALSTEMETHQALSYCLDEISVILRKLYLRADNISSSTAFIEEFENDPSSLYEKYIETPSPCARQLLKQLGTNSKWRYQRLRSSLPNEFNDIDMRNHLSLPSAQHLILPHKARGTFSAEEIMDNPSWDTHHDVGFKKVSMNHQHRAYFPFPEHLEQNSKVWHALEHPSRVEGTGIKLPEHIGIKLHSLPLVFTGKDQELFHMALQESRKWFRCHSLNRNKLADSILKLELKGDWFKESNIGTQHHHTLIDEKNLSTLQGLRNEFLADKFKEDLWGNMSEPEKVLFVLRDLPHKLSGTENLMKLLEPQVFTMEEKWEVSKLMKIQHHVDAKDWFKRLLRSAGKPGLKRTTSKQRLNEQSRLSRQVSRLENNPQQFENLLKGVVKKKFQISDEDFDKALQLITLETRSESGFQDILVMSKMKNEDLAKLIEHSENISNGKTINFQKLKSNIKEALKDARLRVEVSAMDACISVSRRVLKHRQEQLKLWEQNRVQSSYQLRKQTDFLSYFLVKIGYTDDLRGRFHKNPFQKLQPDFGQQIS